MSPPTRKPNRVATVPITIRTTRRVQELLQYLVDLEIYGKTDAAVAEQLVREGLRRLFREDEAMVGRPPGRKKGRLKQEED